MGRWSWLLLIASCTKDPGETDTDPPDTDDTDDTGVDAGPCASGWGAITDTDAVHVRADGDDAGDGTIDAPVATLDAALVIVRAGGPKRIAVGPGTFPTSLSLAHDLGAGVSDDGLAIQGCSPEETTFEASDPEAPVLKATAVEGLTLAGFATSGGRRAIWLWQGADVAMSDVTIRGAERLGLCMDGSITALTAENLSVTDTVSDDGAFGYGISVQGSTIAMTGGEVSGSQGVGIFADFAVVDLDGVTVSGTTADTDGRFGRGVQLQGLTAGTLTNLVLSDNRDAALYASQALDTTVSGLTISSTSAITLDSGSTTGDGIVITQGDAGEDPATYQVTVEDNHIAGSSRAAIVLEGVTAAVSGNVATDNGYSVDGTSIVAQDGAVVSGSDAVFVTTSALEVEHTALVVDPLLD